MSRMDVTIQLPKSPHLGRFSRTEFYQLAETGVIPNRHIELMEGEIIQMAPQRDPHALAVVFTDYALRRVFGEGFTIRVQLPFSISDVSEPEPDIAVLAGTPRSQVGHPKNALLLVEVAEASLEYDRTRKAGAYAEAGVEEYWIVNLNSRCVETFRHPIFDPVKKIHRYADVQIVFPPAAISPLAAAHATIAVADLLP